MAQAKMYQVDYLSGKLRDAFQDYESILDQELRMEEAEFIRAKKEEIAKKLGADKIKSALIKAQEQLAKAQEDAKDFMKTFANKHRLQDSIGYRFGKNEKFTPLDVDEQVDDFARKYARTYMKKTKAQKHRESLLQIKNKCRDAIKLTNDIEEAQAKVENILKNKAPFVLEQYNPDVSLLEAPKRKEEVETTVQYG
jgi:uncharacterized protein YpuA (DUF1002 family)